MLTHRSALGAAAIAGAATIALIIGVLLAWRHYAPPAEAPTGATATLFTHTFDDADGKPQALRQWQGSLLVVNFWATWCAPCVEEMPDLETIQAEYGARGVQVIGLAIDNAEPVRRFRNELKIELPLLLAGAAGTQLGRELGNASGALPYTVLIDRSGRIVQAKLGQLRAAELRRWLDAQLQAG